MGYLSGRRTSQTSPGKNDNLPLVTATSTVWGSCSIGLLLVLQSRPPQASLICGFCSSARGFALRWTFQPPQSGFLRIPPRDGHPCLWLTVPATESVVDFHHQVIAHAGRTTRSRGDSFLPPRFLVFIWLFCYGPFDVIRIELSLAEPGCFAHRGQLSRYTLTTGESLRTAHHRGTDIYGCVTMVFSG